MSPTVRGVNHRGNGQISPHISYSAHSTLTSGGDCWNWYFLTGHQQVQVLYIPEILSVIILSEISIRISVSQFISIIIVITGGHSSEHPLSRLLPTVGEFRQGQVWICPRFHLRVVMELCGQMSAIHPRTALTPADSTPT